jgi:Gon7 family
MTNVTARYTSPTHSVNIQHPVNPSDDSQKASLEALHRAILATQTEINAFLTERKLEEDGANGINGVKRSHRAEDVEVEEEEEEDEEN